MTTCSCPNNLESMSQLCGNCQADYLNYLDEFENKGNREPEPDAASPAPSELAQQFEALEEFVLEQNTHAAHAIGNMLTRLTAVETELKTIRSAA